jgi:hypothetical protein
MSLSACAISSYFYKQPASSRAPRAAQVVVGSLSRFTLDSRSRSVCRDSLASECAVSASSLPPRRVPLCPLRHVNPVGRRPHGVGLVLYCSEQTVVQKPTEREGATGP